MNCTPSIGDLLIRPKFFNLVPHEGVFVGRNTVFHNTPVRGEHLSTLEDFAAGQEVTVQRTGADANAVSARFQKAIRNPQPYSALFRNCQHSASAVIKGVAMSPFAIISGILIVGFLLWALFAKR